MITGESIERAEKILQLTYTTAENMPKQLQDMLVDKDAFTNWLGHRRTSAMEHYWAAYKRMDPRIEAAYNTLLMHFFLVGLVAGRNEAQVIE